MSNQSIIVTLEERTVVRKGLRSLRLQGKVPAVIHDHGKESIHVTGDYVPLAKMYAEAGKHHPVELKVGTKGHLALVKDVDYEPAKHTIRHIVFQAIKQNEKVEAEIPLTLAGEIPAVKSGMMVLQQLDTIQVEAFPKDLPDELVIDATMLVNEGDHITVADIKPIAGVTITTDPGHQVAVVEMPKDQLAEANASAEALAADAAGASSDEAGSADSKAEPDAESSEEK